MSDQESLESELGMYIDNIEENTGALLGPLASLILAPANMRESLLNRQREHLASITKRIRENGEQALKGLEQRREKMDQEIWERETNLVNDAVGLAKCVSHITEANGEVQEAVIERAIRYCRGYL